MLVYGFPQGGSTLSITKGIVSRIEFTGYGENTSGVRVQVDAAINPGNSGGPALIDGKMVGLIFSKLTQADNIGYIIPSEEIDLFLKDVADGTYDGKPAMHDSLQTLENDALRSFLQLDKKTQGMVVHAPDPADPKDPLKPFDLITKIGDHEIDNTGMVKINDNLRLRFQYLIQKLAQGRQGPPDRRPPGQAHQDRLAGQGAQPDADRVAQGEVSVLLHLRPAGLLAGDQRVRLGVRAVRRRSCRSPATRWSPAGATTRGSKARSWSSSPRRSSRTRSARGTTTPSTRSSRRSTASASRTSATWSSCCATSKEKYTTISFDDRASETIVFDHQEALKATEDVLSDNGIRQQASDDLAADLDRRRSEPRLRPSPR